MDKEPEAAEETRDNRASDFSREQESRHDSPSEEEDGIPKVTPYPLHSKRFKVKC